MQTIKVKIGEQYCVELHDGEKVIHKHILLPRLVDGMPDASEIRFHYEAIVHPDYITEEVKKEFGLI